MRVLILGAYCSCNVGDALICQCVERRLRRAYPEASITIGDFVARDRLAPKAVPEEAMLRRRALFARGREALCRWGIDRITPREEARVRANRAHLESLCSREYDLAVVAGGQLFMNGYALLLEKALELLGNTPVIFNAIGAGPLCPAIQRRLENAVKRPNVLAISTRESGPVQIADPALGAAELFGIRKKVSETVGLGVMYPNGVPYGRALRKWRQLIRELDRRGEPWELFTNGDPADEVFARRVLKAFPGRENRIAPRCVTAQQLLETVSGYRGILSYRLHSHIAAVSMDIPSVALVWDEKLRGFFESLGCPERCFPVNTPAKEILAGLDTAAREGYSRALLEESMAAGESWLLSEVKRGLGI